VARPTRFLVADAEHLRATAAENLATREQAMQERIADMMGHMQERLAEISQVG
jgi:hypothetical protein